MVPDIAGACRTHLDYMKWADEIALSAVAEHMPESLTTLQHIYLAEEVWLARVRGNATVRLAELQAPADIGEMRRLWPELHRGWLDFAASAGDWDAPVGWRSGAGVDGQSPLWQVVFHVANHGSYHRGQVSATLRAAGHKPPATDLIAYYRSR